MQAVRVLPAHVPARGRPYRRPLPYPRWIDREGATQVAGHAATVAGSRSFGTPSSGTRGGVSGFGTFSRRASKGQALGCVSHCGSAPPVLSGWLWSQVTSTTRRGRPSGCWWLGCLYWSSSAVPLWIRYGGAEQGPLPYIPENPAAISSAARRSRLRPETSPSGDSLLCENFGVLVGAKVPKPGHTTTAQFVGSEHTATIKIRVRDDGVVIARCP